MTMIDPYDYSISVRRGEFEGEICFEANVKELPDITEYADSFEEAYALVIDSIETTMEIFAEKGRDMPVPNIPANDYSGRVTLRLPKSLHRSLSDIANEESVSLNSYLCNILSYYSGFATAVETKPASLSWSPIEKTIQQEKPKRHLKIVREESSLRKEVKWQKTA